jgi:TonB family protein
MRKFGTKLIVLFSTFLVGLTAYSLSQLFLSDLANTNLETNQCLASVQILPNQSGESKISDSYDISPCEIANPYKRYSSKVVGTISAGAVNWRAECGLLPKYPQNKNSIYGVVTVFVLIDEFGEVIKARATSGNPLFHKSAVEATLQTRFVPIILGGQPVKVRGVLIYEFNSRHGVKLQKSKAPLDSDETYY